MTAEAGVTVLFHSTLVGAEREGEVLRAVEIANRAGVSRIEAQIFIDASGDADLAFRAGVPCIYGRGDGACQPMTMNFKMAYVDTARVRVYARENPEEFEFLKVVETGIQTLYTSPRLSLGGYRTAWMAARERGEVDIPRGDVLFFETAIPGVVAVNSTRVQGLDATDPLQLSQADAIGRQQVQQVVRFLNNHAPGFENAVLIETPPQIGIRESRHPKGLYWLQAEDLQTQKQFADPVVQAGYPIDIHATKAGEDSETVFLAENGAYQIPLRSLLAGEPNNLVYAGRAICATHEASAALRVSPIAMAIGQAAGSVAALAVQSNIPPTDVAYENVRSALIAQRASLPAPAPELAQA
jgi:hypothetical protein